MIVMMMTMDDHDDHDDIMMVMCVFVCWQIDGYINSEETKSKPCYIKCISLDV